MWKIDARYTEKEKQNFLKEFSNKLLQLKGKIEQLNTISVNFNAENTSESNYDLILDTTFESLKDLEAYSNHPEHILVGEFSKTFKKQRSCVDYHY
jgi:hypothetical protein